jgi:hypothetical protein
MKTYTIQDEKYTLLSKIRIIDNFLPNYDFNKFTQQYNFDGMQDNMRDGYTIGQDNEFPHFGALLAQKANLALKKIGYGKISKVKTEVLIVSDISSKLENSRHIDDTSNDEFGYTLSYHWMGTDNAGGTNFYQDFKEKTPLMCIPFKQNRLVVFPAKIPHQGYANINYPYNSKRVIYTLFTILESFI